MRLVALNKFLKDEILNLMKLTNQWLKVKGAKLCKAVNSLKLETNDSVILEMVVEKELKKRLESVEGRNCYC